MWSTVKLRILTLASTDVSAHSEIIGISKFKNLDASAGQLSPFDKSSHFGAHIRTPTTRAHRQRIAPTQPNAQSLKLLGKGRRPAPVARIEDSIPERLANYMSER